VNVCLLCENEKIVTQLCTVVGRPHAAKPLRALRAIRFPLHTFGAAELGCVSIREPPSLVPLTRALGARCAKNLFGISEKIL